MSELEDLKKRVAELEKATKAPEPFVPMPMPRRDLTEGMSMDRASMRRMAAVDTSGLHEDLRAFQQQQQDPNHPQQCLNANVVQVGSSRGHSKALPAWRLQIV